MKTTFKIFFLVMALVVPSLIYIFLRGFGDNKFEIPVYYQNGIAITGCDTQNKTTHLVEFENYKLTGPQLFYFPQWVNDDEFFRQCNRIKAKHPKVTFTAIADSSNYQIFENVLLVSDEQHLFEIANCSLVLGQGQSISEPLYNQLVLVDEQKRIRGYFSGHKLEEMDRLDMELDILKRETK
jgi:protein SCO1